MKKNTAILLFVFAPIVLFAQEVRLTDSVIFINNVPVAFYAKEINNSPLRYNVEVYNFNEDVLIKAEVIKFEAPVYELKPFYYYELTFPPTGDTFAIYIEEEAFPLVLGNIIRDYNLISKNKLNRKTVRYFKATYYGGPALLAKLKVYEDYLDRTRYYREQVKRDRTKPVKILNDRVIMQDGKKIGMITESQTYTNKAIYDYTMGIEKNNITYTTGILKDIDIFFPNQRKVDFDISGRIDYEHQQTKLRDITGKSLYSISKTKKIAAGSYTDLLLKKICYLIEEYAL